MSDFPSKSIAVTSFLYLLYKFILIDKILKLFFLTIKYKIVCFFLHQQIFLIVGTVLHDPKDNKSILFFLSICFPLFSAAFTLSDTYILVHAHSVLTSARIFPQSQHHI